MQSFHRLVQNPHFILIARTILGFVLVAASIVKISNQRKFIQIVRSYELLPKRAAGLVGRILAVSELVVGSTLLLGFLQPWPALAATGLFSLFCGAVSINLLRGRREIACGCFELNQEKHLTWNIALRNAAFSIIAATVAISYSNFSPLPFSYEQLKVEQLSIEEKTVTVLLAGAAFALWWLGNAFLLLRHLPDPGQSCGGCSEN